MKKTYIIPTTEIEILTEQETILAGSPDGFDNNLGGDADAVDGGDALGREDDDLWED
jgi:hypothetical protein